MEDHCIDWNREARTDEESKRLLGTAQINPFLATQRGVYGAGIDPPTGRDRTTLEIDGVPVQTAKEALSLAAAKLPIKTRFVARIAE